MVFEIFTFGGGELLVETFNAAVRIFSDGNFTSALRISLAGTIFVLAFDLIFNGDFTKSLKWYLYFLVFYNVAFVPKVTVKITDPVNQNMIMGSTIDNVPFVLGFPVSIITSIGNALTKSFEMNFSLPEDLEYSKNGMLFGSSIMINVNSSRIGDPRVLRNLNNYYRQCLITGVMLGKYSMEDISKETDLLTFITRDGSGVITYEYTNSDNTKTIYRCSESSAIEKDIKGETNKVISRIERFFSSDGSNNVNMNTLSAINNSYSYILGISKNASEIIQQNLMISALVDATEDYIGSTGASASATNFAIVKDDMQKKMTATVSNKQANKWLPILRIHTEAFLFGIFPFIILLAVTPTGSKYLACYFGGLIYLQLWSPLFAIFHRLSMASLASGGSNLIAATSDGITLSNFVAIQNLNDKIATQAGLAVMSIPIIAGIIMRGCQSIGLGLAQGLSSNAQYTAGQASAEASSGNISLGNVSLDNSNYNNTHANKKMTDYVESYGKRTISDGSGFSRTTFEDGSSAVDTSAMQSHLLVDKNLVNSESLNISKELAETSAMRRQIGKDLSDSQTYTNSIENGLGRTHSIRVNDSSQLTDGDKEIIDRSKNMSLGININGTGGGISESKDRIRELAKQGIISIEDSSGNDITENYRHSLSRQENLNNTISKLSSKESSLSNRQNYLNNLSLEERENLSNELVKYTANKYSLEEQQRILSDKDLTSREFSKMILENNNYGINKIKNSGYGVNTDILEEASIGDSYSNDTQMLKETFGYNKQNSSDQFSNKREEVIKNVDLFDKPEEGFKNARLPKKLRDKLDGDK